jgi:hypothetical protein
VPPDFTHTLDAADPADLLDNVDDGIGDVLLPVFASDHQVPDFAPLEMVPVEHVRLADFDACFPEKLDHEWVVRVRHVEPW